MAAGIYVNLVGHKFNRLTVVERSSTLSSRRVPLKWKCICDCGNEVFVPTGALRGGTSKSCGCLSIEILRKNRTKHMENKTSKEYMAWCGMKARCYNKNNPKYLRYGLRGICVSERWKNSFENFLSDMGRAPSPLHSLDRICNDGNYENGNCRWATGKIQCNNKSDNVNIEHLGQVKTMKQWAEHYGLNYKTLHGDLKYNGYTLEQVLIKNHKIA